MEETSATEHPEKIHPAGTAGGEEEGDFSRFFDDEGRGRSEAEEETKDGSDVDSYAPRHPPSLKKKACVVKIDNLQYTIVATSPDGSSKNQGGREKRRPGVNFPPIRENPITKHDSEKKLTTAACFICPDADMENAFKKLRALHAKVNKGQSVNLSELKKTLEYSIEVANRTYFIHQSPSGQAEEVFDSESVPFQVRDWLTMTFTRSQHVSKDEVYEGTRFKSIANAIRAGISVEKILKSNLSKAEIPDVVIKQLTKIDNWTFDIFALNDASPRSHGFRHVARTIINNHDIVTKFKIPKNNMDCFFLMLEEGYRKNRNPYHNELHAADVTQTVNCFLMKSELKNYLTDLEIYSVLFAALIHDFEHTGTTNTFHVNSRSDLAIMYNDRAVLENFHISQVFRKMMQDSSVNVVSGLSMAEFNEFRYSVVDIVLATDMSFHFQQLKLLKSAMSPPEINLTMLQTLCAIVHFADISHPAKPWRTHKTWTRRLFDEFFLQGDREAELHLPISPLCDRHNTMLAESQIGFIDFIISPTVNSIFEALPLAVNLRMEEVGQDITEPVEKEDVLKFKEEIESCMTCNRGTWMKEATTKKK